MRTTISLPDDIYELASSVARNRQISLGDAVAELIRRPSIELRICLDPLFPYIDAPPGTPQVTMEETLRAIEQMNDEEDARKALST